MRLFFAMTEMTQFWVLGLKVFSLCERHSALDEEDSDYYAYLIVLIISLLSCIFGFVCSFVCFSFPFRGIVSFRFPNIK